MDVLPSLDSVRAKLDAMGIVMPPGPVRLDGYGDSPKLSQELLALIRQGPKRAGTSLLWALQAENDTVPEPGTFEIVLDHRMEPALLTRITSVAVLPFDQVTAEYAAVEGEGDASLEFWRRAHWAFFSRECQRLGREPATSMPVVCCVFELLGVLSHDAVAVSGMPVLFGSRGSGSAAIEVALRQCGLPYRRLRASSWEPDSALDELEFINPLRQVPCLVLADGSVMTESAAILIHLGLACPGSGLLPQAAPERAQILRGLVFVAANCYAALGINDYPDRWTRATTRLAREQVRQAARRQLHHHWNVFADSFATDPFFHGTVPGALDILVAVVSKWAGTRQHLAKSRPALLKTIRSIESHPWVQPVFREHWGA